MRIRRAGPDDGTELARLRYEFTEELHPGLATEDQTTFRERLLGMLTTSLASGRWTVWVADIAGSLVGNVWVERVDKVPRPYSRPDAWGYVTNMYVDPSHRNAGIGSRLLDEVIAAATHEGWEQLLLWPSEASGRFYDRAGFRADGELLALAISPDRGEDQAHRRAP